MVAINEKLMPGAGPQNLPIGGYYLLQDTLYRAAALTDSNGNIVEAYDCDAYGNTLVFTDPGPDGTWFTDDDVQSSSGASSIIYCGYRYDPETENYYVRNRFYSPTLGRWLTRDPIGYAGGINLYEHVGSSPAGNSDPWGLQVYLGPGSGWGDNGSRSAVVVPQVTGIPHVDAKTYLGSIKDHELGAAKDFIQAAAKKYAEDGDSNTLAKALRNLATGSGGIQAALGEAADAVISKGLDAASKDLGAALQAEVGVLRGLSSGPCVTMLEQLYQAFREAKKGDSAPCQTISMSNHAFSNCQQAIYNTGSSGGVWVGTFARKARLACDRLAAKECKGARKKNG